MKSMDKVINDFTNMARSIVEAVILATPAPGSPPYWALIGALLALLALLVIWLMFRLFRVASGTGSLPAKDEPHITFTDVSAEAAAEAMASAARDEVVPLQGIAAAPPSFASADRPAPGENEQPASGFTFFRKRSKDEGSQSETANPEDDVFLLGLEQELLATRQLYLDGLISKEVYVTETRALYDKAQTRMT